jgi:glycopeptide antibiotics resistance protein
MAGFSYRITNVDDAIMNATGATAAFLVWRWLRRLAARGLESRAWLPKP